MCAESCVNGSVGKQKVNREETSPEEWLYQFVLTFVKAAMLG
jgi:hypothetical protein